MIAYPDYVLACPATVALVLRTHAGELPREDYFAAWDALADPDAYEPSDEVRIWMMENWDVVVPLGVTLPQGDDDTKPVPAIAPPVLRKEWMQPFLEEYVNKGGVIRAAAEAADVSRETVRLYLKHDPDFARAVALVEEDRKDVVRSAYHGRAIDGWEEPVYGTLPGPDAGTGVVGTKRVYDNRLLMRLAESCLPEFRALIKEGATQVSATANASAQANQVVITKERLEALQARTRRRLEKQIERLRTGQTTPGPAGEAGSR